MPCRCYLSKLFKTDIMKTFKTLATALCLAILASCNSSQQNAATTENTNGMKSENQVIETIMTRRSIRQYKAEPVKRETMETILKCGINAPSGMNKQSWEVRVVDNPQAVAKLKELLVQGNPQANPNAVEGCFRNALPLFLWPMTHLTTSLQSIAVCSLRTSCFLHGRSALDRSVWAALSAF